MKKFEQAEYPKQSVEEVRAELEKQHGLNITDEVIAQIMDELENCMVFKNDVYEVKITKKDYSINN